MSKYFLPWHFLNWVPELSGVRPLQKSLIIINLNNNKLETIMA